MRCRVCVWRTGPRDNKTEIAPRGHFAARVVELLKFDVEIHDCLFSECVCTAQVGYLVAVLVLARDLQDVEFVRDDHPPTVLREAIDAAHQQIGQPWSVEVDGGVQTGGLVKI